METKEIFAKRLVNLREEKGITQQTLADDLGITRQSLSLYEKAERTINIDLIVKIAGYFNVSTDYLLGKTDVKSTDTNIKSVCDYLCISEKSARNIRINAQRGKSLDPLLELYDVRLLADYLDDIKRLATQKSYYTNVILPIVYGEDSEGNLKNWYADFIKDEVPICKYNCHYKRKERGCNNCEDLTTDKDYILQQLKRAFYDLVCDQLGLQFSLDGMEIQYDENSDLAEFHLNKQIAAIVKKIKFKANIDVACFEKYNKRIREYLEKELSEIESYIVHFHNEGRFDQEEKDKAEAAALREFLEKYDQNFKIKR